MAPPDAASSSNAEIRGAEINGPAFPHRGFGGEGKDHASYDFTDRSRRLRAIAAASFEEPLEQMPIAALVPAAKVDIVDLRDTPLSA
jgi:hypothetical protein